MKRAKLMLLEQPRKREECDQFAAGLEACGYKVHRDVWDPKPDDVMVCWNRTGHAHTMARRFEQARARVIVAENGYLGAQWLGRRWYAIALGHHNGWGRWPAGGTERWDALGVQLAPMRPLGGEMVLLAQRGIAEPAMRTPDGWAATTARLLGARIRRHPGTSTAGPSLEDDLRDASIVATWSSAAAIRALVMGLHVVSGLPRWIAAPATAPVGDPVLNQDLRLPMLQRLAWAQWSADEVVTGEPFRRLLQC